MKLEQGLWSREYRDRRHPSPKRHGKRLLGCMLGCLSGILDRVFGRVVPIQKDGVIVGSNFLESTDRRIP